jgi:hypothetical protein
MTAENLGGFVVSGVDERLARAVRRFDSEEEV